MNEATQKQQISYHRCNQVLNVYAYTQSDQQTSKQCATRFNDALHLQINLSQTHRERNYANIMFKQLPYCLDSSTRTNRYICEHLLHFAMTYRKPLSELQQF